eukprot:gene15920-21600_t
MKRGMKWVYADISYLCETRLREANVPRVDIIQQFTDPIAVAMDMFRSLLKEKSRKLTPTTQWAFVEEQIRLEPTALYVNLSIMMAERWTSYDVVTSVDFRSAVPGGVQGLIIAIFDRLKREHGQFIKALKQVFRQKYKQMIQTSSAIRFPYHLREAAEIYLVDLKFDLHKIMGVYYGNLVEPNQQMQRRITSHELIVDGKSPLDDTSQVNLRRCFEATHLMIQGEMLHEAVRELCDFGGICSRIRSGERFNLISHLIGLKTKLGEYASRENYLLSIKEVDHYLRWLRCDIYFLSKTPISLLTVSASSQPMASVVRTQSNKLFQVDQIKSNSLPKSFVRSTMLGGLVDFDSMLMKLESHTDRVTFVSFSPNGRRLVSGSWDKSIRIWDVETGESLLMFNGHSGAVYSVSFSPDGMRIVSAGSLDKSIRIWDVETGESLLMLIGH